MQPLTLYESTIVMCIYGYVELLPPHPNPNPNPNPNHRSLSQNVVRGLAFEYEHEVLKGQYPQILTVRYRFPHGRPGSVHSGFKLSDHIVQSSTDVSSYYV